MKHHLFLVGYRGTGKSSIGRRLGELLKRPVADSDDCIEQAARKSIRAIFADDGETCFRDLESKAIHDIATNDTSTIVALGGGAIVREQNRAIIKDCGSVVWLQASVSEIARRINNDAMTNERRPALTQLGANEEIVRLLTIREPMYREVADFKVETDHRTVEDIASEIAAWYSEAERSEMSERAS